ncbi:alpha-N-acetylglucosaminidase-like isoform X2 [Mya arenaria]|uniref:alpha-N-acetylglucosaminidase-like isoform X2 n=1 Tax=Mya arenaria TaxID=6604 RepID=UPI0022E4A11C|nr:alpha-N-acetylglucosaminidase-like isoform X2 [Mya arenaria]
MRSCLMLSLFSLASAISDFPALDHIRPSSSLFDQQQAATDLIVRRLGADRAKQFTVKVVPNADPQHRDTFTLISDGNLVSITGTSGVAASMGFYFYLKTYCGCQFTWAGEQLDLPHPLPVIVKPGVSITTNDRFRYYQNVCTVSYSSVWWTWERWERHIDWMAMNGINLPLAFTGQEAMFQKVYMKLGFTEDDLSMHWGGPAFLAWARMGNMHGWGGPLPQSWMSGQLALQHRILNRTRGLGMIPVLPGFAGHVPLNITRLYPNANVSRLGDWGHFNSTYCCTYLLDFTDPLYNKIGSLLVQTMQEEFGTDHVYNADSFNEMSPRSSDPSYLHLAGKATYKAMTDADPDAIWLMQGWLFQSGFWQQEQIQAYLTAVPQGKMIVLDLFAETSPIYSRTKSFYGQPFIWCMLHDFGGTMELFGTMDSINKGPFLGRHFEGSSMIGTGLTPEGIFQNEVVYEFMNENAYAPAPRNLTQWFSEFARNRYGQYNSDADQTWQLLRQSVLNNTDKLRDHSKFVVPTSRPNIKEHLPDVWYDPKKLYMAWKHLVAASESLRNNTLFRYDLVDVGRNSLQMISVKFYIEMVAAYKAKSVDRLKSAGEAMLKILNDLDQLLGTDHHFLLGPWIEDARAWGTNEAEKNLMEFNARNQVTLWGPTGQIRDYAAKQWSFLISGYYAPRWKTFYETLMKCLNEGTKYNQTAFQEIVLETVEQPFSYDRTPVPVQPRGDAVVLSRTLYQQYQPVMQSSFYDSLEGWAGKGSEGFTMAINWLQERWGDTEVRVSLFN